MNIYRWLRQNPIAVYLILANGLTWLGWLPALIFCSQYGYPLPVIGNFREWLPTAFSSARQSFITLAFILAVYGPLLAVIIATWLDTGKDGLADLWRQILKWRVGRRWYLAIVVIPVILVGLPIGLGAMFGLVSINTAGLLLTVA